MKLSVTRQSIARCLKIILGNFLITGAYAFITVPNEIVNGGVTSFSMILGNLLSIDLTYLVDFFTILLLILCYIFLGKKFFTGTVFSCFCYLILFSVLHGLDMQSWFIRSSAWFWPDSLSAPDIISASVPNPLL